MPDRVEIHGVAREEVHIIWPLVDPILQRATDLVEEDTSAIFRALTDGEAGLTVGVKDGQIVAACVTEIKTTQRGTRFANIRVIAGSHMRAWVHAIKDVETWALEQGCKRLTFDAARPGWARVLRPYGFHIKQVILEKECGNAGRL